MPRQRQIKSKFVLFHFYGVLVLLKLPKIVVRLSGHVYVFLQQKSSLQGQPIAFLDYLVKTDNIP